MSGGETKTRKQEGIAPASLAAPNGPGNKSTEGGADPPLAAPKPSADDGGLLYYKQEVGLSGWSQHVDDISGRTYWFSSRTQESTWVEPVEVTAARAAAGRGDNLNSLTGELPRAVDSHLGKVFADDRRGSAAQASTSIREEAYVPVSFACKQLEEMEKGMKQAQRRFAKQTDEMVGYYGEVEKANTAHYLAFINGLKKKAVRRIGHYKAVLDKTVREAAQYRKTAEETISSSQASNSRLLVEKAALLKKMQSDQNAMKTKHDAQIAKLRATGSEEAEAKRKRAAEIAVALKAESKDLSREKNKILSEVKAMQSEHQKKLDEILTTVAKMTDASGQSSDKTAVAVVSEPVLSAKSDDPGSQKNTARKPMTPREITDSAEIDGLRRQLESARRTEASLREEIQANQAAALAATSEMSIPSGEAPSDLGQLQKELAEAKRASASLLARNKSLEVEVKVSKQQAVAAEAAAAKAAETAATSLSSSVEGNEDISASNVINKLQGEILALKNKLAQSGSGDDADTTETSAAEVAKLRKQLDDTNVELSITREELDALRGNSDAKLSSEVGEGAQSLEKLSKIEDQQAALEKKLQSATAAAAAAATAAEGAGPVDNSSSGSESAYHTKIRTCIDAGRVLWSKGDKDGCAKLYLDCAEEVFRLIGNDAPGSDILKAAIRKAKKRPPARAAMAVRKAFDQYLVVVPDGTTPASSSSRTINGTSADAAAAQFKEVQQLKEQMEALQKKKREIEAAQK
eukprot:g1759.t1